MESAFLVALTSGGEKRHVLLKLELKLYVKDLQELAGGMRVGEGPNYLCMPESPEYNSDLKYREGIEGSSNIYGVEYEFPVQGTHDDNAPCTRTIVNFIHPFVNLSAIMKYY